MIVIGAILWYVLGQIISTRLRKITKEGWNIPTKWSIWVYWLSLFGAILIEGIGLSWIVFQHIVR